jgi:hypothetical protein
MLRLFKIAGKLLLWLVVAYAAAWVAYWLHPAASLYWGVFSGVFVLGVALEFRLLRLLGFATVLLAMSALAVSTATAAPMDDGSSSDWFGGYTISPDWNPVGYIPPQQWCRDIDTWHTGRAIGVVDYEFHLYAHICGVELPNGSFKFTVVKIHTGLTHDSSNNSATAHYDGVYQATNNYYTCQLGLQLRYVKNGCLHVIRKAQITHHVPLIPGVTVGVGHAVVAIDIGADGSLGFWPYHNESQF